MVLSYVIMKSVIGKFIFVSSSNRIRMVSQFTLREAPGSYKLISCVILKTSYHIATKSSVF